MRSYVLVSWQPGVHVPPAALFWYSMGIDQLDPSNGTPLAMWFGRLLAWTLWQVLQLRPLSSRLTWMKCRFFSPSRKLVSAVVFSASGLTAVPVEMARGARARGLRVVAVTSVAQSMSGKPNGVGSRLLDEADLVIDLCTPQADALCTIKGLDTPVGPGSTIAAVAIVNAIKVRVAELLTERGAMPPVITRSSVVGEERSRELFDQAYREHARRIARAIDQQGGG